MNEYLQSGTWFNKSRRFLIATAVLTAAFFVLLCGSIEFFVAQYFVCIGSCKDGAPLPLVLVSGLLGLIPVLGMALLGYWIARGLWEDARQVAAEEAAERDAAAEDLVSNPAV